MHVYRWDLDRTYLETEIHSVRGLVRAAFEDAASKRTVPGAGALLRGLVTHDTDVQVVILSGSPTQMREVLLEKLALDGVKVDRLILKDNLGNLKRGRLRAVRGQVGYKLPALLRERGQVASGVTETLFGDDSEADAVIYSAYAEAVEGRLDALELQRVLEAGQAYPDTITAAVDALERIEPGQGVEDIFIRVDRGIPVARYRMLGPRVIPVFSWLQAALVLSARGRLDPPAVLEVTQEVIGQTSMMAAVGYLQDAVRRRLVTRDDVLTLLEADSLADLARVARGAIAGMGEAPAASPGPGRPDLIGFLRGVTG